MLLPRFIGGSPNQLIFSLLKRFCGINVDFLELFAKRKINE